MKNGCRSLVGALGFLDVPGTGVGKEIEMEAEVHIVNRSRPRGVPESCGQSHRVLLFNEILGVGSELRFIGQRDFIVHGEPSRRRGVLE